MDPLRRQEIEALRETPPEDRLRQALDLMQTGIDLKRASLRTRSPDASEEEIDAQLDAWLASDG